MRVVFRADASSRVGTGHVMRCVTLAAALRARGVTILFVCREEVGDLRSFIAGQKMAIATLATATKEWQADAEATSDAIKSQGGNADWLVVDHYGLDHRWERALRSLADGIMVIDDLADRSHDCDILLDQNLENPRHRVYQDLVPGTTRCLLGPKYAIVRPEFAQLRPAALARRAGRVERVLVSMGGADPENDTAKVLMGFATNDKSPSVDVVVGASNPHQAEIRELCSCIPTATLHVQTPRMAQLMHAADLAITGGGSITWERCVLGLPALVAVQSDDQEAIAQAVARTGAHRLLGWSKQLRPEDYARGVRSLEPSELVQMSRVCAELCDGGGAERVATELTHGRH